LGVLLIPERSDGFGFLFGFWFGRCLRLPGSTMPRSKKLSVVGVTLSLLRNYNPFTSPTHFKLTDLVAKFDKCFGMSGKNYGKVTADRTMDDISKRRHFFVMYKIHRETNPALSRRRRLESIANPS
jgi:hypothetical protein